MAEHEVSTPLPTSASGATGDEILGVSGAVVVAVDGSVADEAVVDWAADEAARLGAPLRLVTVVDPQVQLSPYETLVSGSPSLSEHLDEGAHRILDRAAERARARRDDVHDIAVAVPWGPPAAALVRLSENAARVVVGAPARGRLERILLGSVALPVVAHAHCPVAVVPSDTLVSTPRRILVAVDGSKASARAAELAFSIAAAAAGAGVTCVLGWNVEVHEGVVVTERSSSRWDAVEERYAALGHRVVDPVAEQHPGVPVDVVVRHGSPARAVVEVAVERDVDLVVLGRRGAGGFRGLLMGSVSRRVVERAGRVVLVIH
jgi:nucleotide-binding universal stress UspA family protein